MNVIMIRRADGVTPRPHWKKSLCPVCWKPAFTEATLEMAAAADNLYIMCEACAAAITGEPTQICDACGMPYAGDASEIFGTDDHRTLCPDCYAAEAIICLSSQKGKKYHASVSHALPGTPAGQKGGAP